MFESKHHTVTFPLENLPVHGKFEINVVAGMLKKREELLKYSLCDVQTRYANLHIIYRSFKYIYALMAVPEIVEY